MVKCLAGHGFRFTTWLKTGESSGESFHRFHHLLSPVVKAEDAV
jgi:hypothetical protein